MAHKAGLNELGDRFFEMYIADEVEQPKADGRLPPTFTAEDLYAAQAIFNPEEPPVVRLNDEVKYRVVEHTLYGVDDRGHLNYADVTNRKQIELTGDDLNAGHGTLIRRSDGVWYFTVGLLKNSKRIRQYTDVAREFLASAEGAYTDKRWRAFVENLYTAVEQLAKALLLAHADTLELVRADNHSFPRAQFNIARRQDSSLMLYADTYNWLHKNRNRARYLATKPFTVDENHAKSMLDAARG